MLGKLQNSSGLMHQRVGLETQGDVAGSGREPDHKEPFRLCNEISKISEGPQWGKAKTGRTIRRLLLTVTEKEYIFSI